MLTIKNGRILLTRGDSAYINVELTTSTGEVYEMQAGDTLTLTVRQLADDTSAVACTDKTAASGQIQLRHSIVDCVR